MAILLKRLGSDKIIHGFDSFEGFPEYSEFDSLDCFEKYEDKYFGKDLVDRVRLLQKIRQAISTDKLDVKNISTSGEFTDTNYDDLVRKIKLLGLDNINLVKGSFKDTVDPFFKNFRGKVFSANVDCDLYDGYRICLPHLWENLSSGGYIFLDEYYSLKFAGARIATDRFCEKAGIKPLLHPRQSTEFERWYIEK